MTNPHDVIVLKKSVADSMSCGICVFYVFIVTWPLLSASYVFVYFSKKKNMEIVRRIVFCQENRNMVILCFMEQITSAPVHLDTY